MITYVNGTQIQVSEIYKAFILGFSDYIIKVDLAETSFVTRFFGPEGNDVKLCHVALADGEPIGLVMGGIREWDGLKTLRCGALCIASEFRGTDVARTLMDLHWKDGVDHHCQRLSLEVIKGNDRAIRFYEKNGYFPAYDIKYYKIKAENLEAKPVEDFIRLKEVDFKTLGAHRKKQSDIHIHWQSELEYYKESTTDRHFEIQLGDRLAGCLSLSRAGKINYLWIEPKDRNRGLGKNALQETAKVMNLEAMNIAFTNNGSLEGFLRALHFEKDKIEQFEMFNGLIKKGACQ